MPGRDTADLPPLPTEEGLLRRSLDRMLEGFQVVGRDWRYLYLNDTAARQGHRRREELLGRTMMESYPGIDRTPLFGRLRDCMEHGTAHSFENEFEYPDGSRGWFELSVQAVESGILILSMEVTARKLAEGQLRSSCEQLARSNEDLEQFAYITSHDLREPLRNVTAFAELLEARAGERLDGEAREYLRQTVAGVRRMRAMLDGILEYSRVGQDPRLQACDACAALGRALENLSAAVRESGAVVRAEALPALFANEPQLVRLFQNLVGNAIKFNRSRPPEVRVSAARAGGVWTISVADNGIGIDSAGGRRVFDMFQRLNDRDQFAGDGIGLAVCKRIVERHGGRLWFESRPGRGTVFHFTVPAPEGTAEP